MASLDLASADNTAAAVLSITRPDPWSRAPLVIAYDYGGALAPRGIRAPDEGRRESPVDAQAARVIRYLRQTCGIAAIFSSNNLPSEPRRPTLAAAGVLDCFNAVLLPDELGVGKPNPHHHHRLLDTARQVSGGCQPPDIVHVGDNPMSDVAGHPPSTECARCGWPAAIRAPYCTTGTSWPPTRRA